MIFFVLKVSNMWQRLVQELQWKHVFFDKSSETFMPTYYQYHQNTTVFDEAVCVPVFDDFLTTNFWADILSPFLKNTYTVKQKMAFKPNRMRQANCSFWGYQEPNNEQIAVKYDK